MEVESSKLTAKIKSAGGEWSTIEWKTGEIVFLNGNDFVSADTAAAEVSRTSKKLPGMNYITDYPCGCKRLEDTVDEYGWHLRRVTDEPVRGTLWGAVQHLNDKHKEWSRERIADWLDELHESGKVNLEFQPWGEDEPVEEEVAHQLSDEQKKELLSKIKPANSISFSLPKAEFTPQGEEKEIQDVSQYFKKQTVTFNVDKTKISKEMYEILVGDAFKHLSIDEGASVTKNIDNT
jgi:hypothetical protein